MDLNCDIGEASPSVPDPPDAQLFPLITSASIACGGHAGDATSMAVAVRAALTHGVAIGAHPSYPDREGFGRRRLDLPLPAVRAAVAHQVGALLEVARAEGAAVTHVKPHGALYNAAATDEALAEAVVGGVLDAGGPRRLYCPAGSALEAAAIAAGLAPVSEGFPERGYRADGSLQPRGLPGDLVHDPHEVARRALALATGRPIRTVDGAALHVEAATVCVHSDHPGAVANAAAIRALLAAHDVPVSSGAT